MPDIRALNSSAKVIVADGIEKEINKVELTRKGVILYTVCNNTIEHIETAAIEGIILKTGPDIFNVLNNFISFLQADPACSDGLLDFILALWNNDIDRIKFYIEKDKQIKRKYLNYMQGIAPLQEYNAILAYLFENYLLFKQKSQADS